MLQLSVRESAALDVCARLIHERHLATPALLVLGALRPVRRVAATSVQLALPWLDALIPNETARALRDLLERPDGASLLCGLLAERLDVLDRA